MTAALVTPTQNDPARNPRTHRRLPAAIAIAIFAALSIAASVTSHGFLEADACTHYLYARFALEEPHFLVNVWGRPLFTALYAIPSAYGGVAGARLLSLTLAIGCAAVAMLIARGQNARLPVLALIFTLAQPLVFLHSFSELTELPFATLLGLTFLAYQRKQWLVMAVLAGLGPLARPEGFGFLLLAGAALLVHRLWWWIIVLPIPLLIWNHAGWVLSGGAGAWWSWLPDNWPYAQESVYPSGHLLHFLALMPAVTSPFVFPATCAGVWRCLADRTIADPHLRLCRRLIAAIPLMILVGHSVLYATGKLASSGELRYMLVVAPFWGVLAAIGWEWIFDRLHWRRPIAFAGIAALGGAVGNLMYPVLPLKPADDYVQSRRFVEWYRTSGVAEHYPRVCAAQPCIYHFLDISPTDPERALTFHRAAIVEPPPGTILVWDPIYSLYNADSERSIKVGELIEKGWLPAPEGFPAISEGWQILLSDPPPRHDAPPQPPPLP